MKKIVITGLGMVTPLGNDAATTWSKLKQGISGLGLIDDFDVSAYPVKICGAVKNFSLDDVHPKDLKRMDRFVQYAIKSSLEAVNDSGITFTETERDKAGVIIGAGIGGLRIIEQQNEVLLKGGPSRVSPFLIPMLIPDMAAGQVSIKLGLRGMNFATVSACASGAHAIAVAFNMMRQGLADVVIAGGTESVITPLGLAGFCSMKALSRRNADPERASRPFDRERDGFVMGEGAGIVVMETLEHATERRAPNIYCEMLGAGMSCDAYHMTAPDSEGRGAQLCMKYALQDAGLHASDIDYINAHGTSTNLNDKMETVAIKKIFGTRAYDIPISSTKSMIGHLLGSSGAVEAISVVQTLKEGVIHPTINYEFPDPDCDLDYVPNIARKHDVKYAISNSFGFGGHNISLVFGKTGN